MSGLPGARLGRIGCGLATVAATLALAAAACAAVEPDRLGLRLAELGMIDVRLLDPELRCRLKYASADNFMGAPVYGGVERCFLERRAAEKLVAAHHELRNRRPDLRLLVADALRPRSVQRLMWAAVVGTPMQRYVADPKGGSMHNYGTAVDVTLVDVEGQPVDMGTELDHFGPLAQPALEQRFLSEGLLTPEHVANRRLLREVMESAGFAPLPIEWWHFEAFDHELVRSTMPLIETW